MSNTLAAMTHWSNWSGRVTSAPSRQIAPRSEDEIAEVVAVAARNGQKIRVRGTGHSNTALCATDSVLVGPENLTGLLSVDTDKQEAVVRSGTTLSELASALQSHGLAMFNLGDIDVQTIAGAVGTATHGTGPTIGNLATTVVGARIVLADGSIASCSDTENADLFAALRPSLGAMGIVTEITIRVTESYRLHEKIWFANGNTAVDTLDGNIAATRHYEFFWHPSRDLIEHKALALTDVAPDPMPEVKRQRIDYWHHVLPSVRTERFNEMEYSLPSDNGAACFTALRQRMLEKWPGIEWPVEYRTVAADELWLSPHSGRPSVTISVHQAADLPCDELFKDTEAILREHGGRPHWGKVHHGTPEMLRSYYPQWDEWWALRDKVDPEQMFLNPYLTAMRESTQGLQSWP